MWIERRMRSRPGQTSAGAARCTRCDRRGSARSSAVDSTRSRAPAGARAAGSEDRAPRGITSIPARMSSATRTWVRVPTRHDEPSASNAATNRNRSRRPPTRAEHDRVADRRGAFLATTDPRTGSVHALVAARLARSHASKSARLAALVWLVRCFSRRGPLRIPTPALDGSRHQPWELEPGSSLPVRPSNVAGG